VTFDCAHPAALAAFWRLALGYVDASPPEGFASWPEWLADVGVPPDEWDVGAYIEDPEGVRPSISFLKVPEPKVAKNRVHLAVQDGTQDRVVIADPEDTSFACSELTDVIGVPGSTFPYSTDSVDCRAVTESDRHPGEDDCANRRS